jgi:hypothetical protein
MGQRSCRISSLALLQFWALNLATISGCRSSYPKEQNETRLLVRVFRCGTMWRSLSIEYRV